MNEEAKQWIRYRGKRDWTGRSQNTVHIEWTFAVSSNRFDSVYDSKAQIRSINRKRIQYKLFRVCLMVFTHKAEVAGPM